jgi:hypothetical protein
MSDLELYIRQNARPDVQRKRQIRMALRALDGQRITWPYDHIEVSLTTMLSRAPLTSYLYSPLALDRLGVAEAGDTKHRQRSHTSKLSYVSNVVETWYGNTCNWEAV